MPVIARQYGIFRGFQSPEQQKTTDLISSQDFRQWRTRNSGVQVIKQNCNQPGVEFYVMALIAVLLRFSTGKATQLQGEHLPLASTLLTGRQLC